jgi:hypothetical protein
MRTTLIIRSKKLLALSVLTAGLVVPATAAQATNCTTTYIGSASSLGIAGSWTKSTACAPAYGQPAGSDTGRKVG